MVELPGQLGGAVLIAEHSMLLIACTIHTDKFKVLILKKNVENVDKI